jgi:hypothetical protein
MNQSNGAQNEGSVVAAQPAKLAGMPDLPARPRNWSDAVPSVREQAIKGIGDNAPPARPFSAGKTMSVRIARPPRVWSGEVGWVKKPPRNWSDAVPSVREQAIKGIGDNAPPARPFSAGKPMRQSLARLPCDTVPHRKRPSAEPCNPFQHRKCPVRRVCDPFPSRKRPFGGAAGLVPHRRQPHDGRATRIRIGNLPHSSRARRRRTVNALLRRDLHHFPPEPRPDGRGRKTITRRFGESRRV